MNRRQRSMLGPPGRVKPGGSRLPEHHDLDWMREFSAAELVVESETTQAADTLP